MWPLIIAAFTIALVLLLLLVGTRWQYPSKSGLSWSRDGGDASQPGVPITTPIQEGTTTWWDRNIGIQRSIGLLFILGGLWHTAAPWINGYSAVKAAMVSNVAAGLTLAVVGVLIVVLRGATWLNWVAGAVGVWVLVAPEVLAFGGPGLAGNESLWGGPITIFLAILAGLDLRFDRPEATPVAGHP